MEKTLVDRFTSKQNPKEREFWTKLLEIRSKRIEEVKKQLEKVERKSKGVSQQKNEVSENHEFQHSINALEKKLASLHNLPLPCKGQDGGFTKKSVLERVPDILLSVISNNSYSTQINQRIKNLAKSIRSGCKIPEEFLLGLDWQVHEKEFCARDHTWASCAWFFYEHWVYRKLLDLTGFFTSSIDPFQKVKDGAVKISLPGIASTYEYAKRQLALLKGDGDNAKIQQGLIRYLVYKCLWGNKQDLSMSGGKLEDESSSSVRELNERYLLIDDVKSFKVASKRVDAALGYITDNIGAEFYHDLLLASTLLDCGVFSRVTFLVKKYPVLVSDVMIKDVGNSLKALEESDLSANVDMARKCRKFIEAGKFTFIDNAFFNGPLPYWRMNEEVRQVLEKHQFCIIKGDANYRRLSGDMRNMELFKFDDLVSIYFPSEVLAIRTLKAEPLVEEERFEHRIEKLEKEYRENGHYGVIQYSRGKRKLEEK